MTTYPNNTVTEYTTRLPHALELDGQWEIGLAELTYPITWYNVDADECNLLIEMDSGDRLGPIRLPEGRYETSIELVTVIRRLMKKHFMRYGDVKNVSQSDFVSMELNDRTQKVMLQMTGCKVSLSPKLLDLLGFEYSSMQFADKYESVSAADVNRGLNSLYVYCNVVVDSIVGDVRAPLLRTVYVRGRYGDIVREIFVKPLYIPVRRNRFDAIEISIKDETGRPVSFNSGTSCVTLHYKRFVTAIAF